VSVHEQHPQREITKKHN